VQQQRCAQVAEQPGRLPSALRGVGGDPRVQRPAGAHRGVERTHRLLERGIRVEAVRIEDVHIVQTQSVQRLVQRGEQVLTRAELPVRAGPHVPSGFGRDEQLVAVWPEVAGQDGREVRLGRAVARSIVVGQVEMSHAQVERPAHDGVLSLQRSVIAEVVPQTERDRRQLDPAAPAPPVGHRVVTCRCGNVGHRRHAVGSTWSAKRSRRVFLENLPTLVLGTSSMNTTSSGTCQGDIRSRK
jgi:hypothetical protein